MQPNANLMLFKSIIVDKAVCLHIIFSAIIRFWTLNAGDICSSYDVAVIKGNIAGCNPSPNSFKHVDAFVFSANGKGTPVNHSAAQILITL